MAFVSLFLFGWQPETDIPNSPVEILFQAILPNLPQYMIALLKILLAAAPTSKTKTDSINILSDVLPEVMPWVSTLISHREQSDLESMHLTESLYFHVYMYKSYKNIFI